MAYLRVGESKALGACGPHCHCRSCTPGLGERYEHERADGVGAADSLRPRGFFFTGHPRRSSVERFTAEGASLGEPKNARRPLRPEDVAGELVGRNFRLSGPVTVGSTRLPAGTVLTVDLWENALPVTRVRVPKQAPFTVGKHMLRPVASSVPAIALYGANLQVAVDTLQRGIQAIEAWKKKQPQYRTSAAQQLFAKELARLEGLQRTRQQVLNRRHILEAMFNRFDPLIEKWVKHYNAQFGFKGNDALDPNLVKSMMFQESRMGTSGRHLEVPPSHVVKTRFNLGQVIDSSGSALLIIMQELQPHLITAHHLQGLSANLEKAKRELRALSSRRALTLAERARLAKLRDQSRQSWESFIWRYRAQGKQTGFSEAVRDFFAATSPPRNEAYEFWIRAMVRWLFRKRPAVKSWEEAVRAYNGGGPRADQYRDEVVQRSRDAVAERQAGRLFVPAELR